MGAQETEDHPREACDLVSPRAWLETTRRSLGKDRGMGSLGAKRDSSRLWTFPKGGCVTRILKHVSRRSCL